MREKTKADLSTTVYTGTECSSILSSSLGCSLLPSVMSDVSQKRSCPTSDQNGMSTPISSPRENTSRTPSSKGKSPVRERKKRGIDPSCVETDATENTNYSTIAIESLRDEVEYRRLIKCFLGENLDVNNNNHDSGVKIMISNREDAGEKLIYLSATEVTAMQLIEYHLLEVCKLLISLPTTPAKIAICVLCIRCNLLSLEMCRSAVISSAPVIDNLEAVLTHHLADPAILSHCLKEFVIIFHQDNIDFQGVLNEKLYISLGNTLNMIQTNSLDPELLSRSWQLAYYITASSKSHTCGDNFIPSWNFPNIIAEAASKNMLELLQSTTVDGSSGLTWLLVFMDTLFSGSTTFAELAVEYFSDEHLEGIMRSLLLLTDSERSNLSRDESFSLLSCFESLFSHISDEDIKNRIDKMQIFDKFVSFILSSGFEAALVRDNELFVSFLMLVRTNFHLIQNLDLSTASSLKSNLNDLMEVLLKNCYLLK